MPKNTSVTIGKHYDDFIAGQIKAGNFNSASEAVRAGLRLLEEREIKFNALRKAIIEGDESEDVEYSLEGIIKELDGE